MKDHVAGVSTEDHPPGQDAAVARHPHEITNQGTSPRRGEMKNNEKSRVMERSGDDPAADDALGTGKLFHSGKKSIAEIKTFLSCFVKLISKQWQQNE